MKTTFRAIVMLAALVGGPAAWMYYGPLPPEAQRRVDRVIAMVKQAIDWDALIARHGGAAEGADTEAAPVFAGGVVRGDAAAVAAAPTPTVATTGATRTLAEQVEPLLAQLRDMGVAAYQLEPWGGAQRLFRFHCEMPLTPGGQATAEFEAVTADPRASIEQVVAEVASWQASRMSLASR